MGLREPVDSNVGSSFSRLLLVVSLPDEYYASSQLAEALGGVDLSSFYGIRLFFFFFFLKGLFNSKCPSVKPNSEF
jgi:hypothetical protein